MKIFTATEKKNPPFKTKTSNSRLWIFSYYRILEMVKETKGTKRSTIHDVVAREYTIHLHKHVHGR